MSAPTMAQSPPALPTNRAFVVQFRSQSEGAHPQWAGRVEHVTSGHATHFSSWEQLQQFLAQILTTEAERPP